jgi:hypothetical protein
MEDEAFALTGLTSRSGFSNWVFFFLPEQLVMIDVGMAPAIKAGMQAGVLGGLDGSYGPQRQGLKVSAWCEQLRAKAKKVVDLPDAQIGGVRLHLRAAAHQLFVTGTDGVAHKFTLMNRREAAAAAKALTQRLGPRFEQSSTALFAFFQRWAPFLMK